MRDDELQLGTRDKVVQKMTREGAVEENMSQNSERRVSARASDADFSHLHEDEVRAAGGDEQASRTKTQQRRYYRGNQGDEPVLERDRDSSGNSDSDNGADFENEISTKVSDGPDQRDGKALQEKSSRSQNVSSDSSRSERQSSDRGDNDQNHQRKKKQVQKAQTEKQKGSRLSFDDDGDSKGTNLGGRFSSVTGKVVQTGKNVVDDSMQAGNSDEDDMSRDTVHKSEQVAVNVSRTVQRHTSGRTKSTSSRVDVIEHEAELKAAKLKFDAETEGVKEAAKASSKASAKASAGDMVKKEAQKHARNKKYASVFRSKNAGKLAGGTAKTAEGTVTIADRIKNTVTTVVKKNKAVIAVGLAVVMMFVALLGGIGAMSSVISGTGTTVMNGVEYTVEDTGNFARYGVAFDVYYDSHSAASAHGHRNWEAYIADDNGSQTVEVTQTRTVRVLNVTLSNSGFDVVARNRLGSQEATNWFNILNAAYGNRDYLWDTAIYSGYTPGGMSYEIPPEALSDVRFRNMITEAEKYLGYPYVWGGASPSTSFDCSGFVSWVINNCGNGWSYGRLTAEGLRGVCTYVSPNQAKPGDLIFFQGTYDTAGASHVGIYVGNGMMIHCGNPIQYTSIESSYWQQHFYCFGRLP